MPSVLLPKGTISKNYVNFLLMECTAQDLKGMIIAMFLDELQLNTHTMCKYRILSIVPLISVAVVTVFSMICEHKIHVQVAYSYCNE